MSKWISLFLKKTHLLGCLDYFSCKLDCGSYIVPVAKTGSKNLELWFVPWSLFILRLLFISTNLLSGLLLRDIVDWDRKWFVDLNCGAIDAKIDGFGLEETIILQIISISLSYGLAWNTD